MSIRNSTYLSNSNMLRKIRGQLTLGGATSGASVAAHGDGHGLLGDVVKVGKGLVQLHTVDGLSGLAGVLEADTKVRAASASALGVLNLLGGVTDLQIVKKPSSAFIIAVWGWWW